MTKARKYALLYGLLFNFPIILQSVYVTMISDSWLKIGFGWVFCICLFSLSITTCYGNIHFNELLNQYVQDYQLTPVDLAQVTGFSRYDFSYDHKHRMTFIDGSLKKRRQLLQQLAEAYSSKKE